MNKICYDRETLEELCKCFPQVSEKTVTNALNGIYPNSLVAPKIRKRALDLGLHEKGEEKVTILK